jgi:hypothetical protein
MQSPEDFAKVPMFSLCLWIANVLYVVAVFSMKLSMVALYWKLFGVDRKSRLPLIVMAFVIIGWSTGVVGCSLQPQHAMLILLQFISVIFACKPIAGSWDIALALTAKCIDKKQFYQGASIPNVITDVILVLMPIPYVLKLHAPMAQRIVLAGIFALGTFVGVVSVIRLSILVGTTNGVPDLTYTFKDVYLWSLIELQVGLICICLPSLRPLVRVLGLNDLFSFSRSRPSHTPDPYRGLSKGKTDQSASRKTNNSLFGTHDGTRIGEEDEFEMIGKPERMEGKNSTWTGQTSRVSCDTDSASHDSAASRLPPQPHAGIGRGITVQREWDVSHSTQR